MKIKIPALVICLSLLCSLLCACSPTRKADKELEKSTYKLKISVDIISESERVRRVFEELESTEAEIRVGDTLTYIHYSSHPHELCSEHEEYWITDTGHMMYRYIMNEPPKAKVTRLMAEPTKEELDLFLFRATTFAGVTQKDFNSFGRDGDILTYTDYRGEVDGYLRDIVFTNASWLAGENDFHGEDITLLGATLSVRLDSKGRYAEQVLTCDYKVLAAGIEHEFTLKVTMTYDFDCEFSVLIPDDYFDDKYTLVPYDEKRFEYLKLPA